MMRSIYKTALLLLCAFLCINASLSSLSKSVEKNVKAEAKKVKAPSLNTDDLMNDILQPLNSLMDESSKLKSSVDSFITKTDTAKNLGNKINLDIINNIKIPEVKTDLTSLFDDILKADKLPAMDTYLTKLNLNKTKIDSLEINLYDQIANSVKDVYSFKDNYSKLINKSDKFKDKITKTQDTVKTTITDSQKKLEDTATLPGIDENILKNITSQFEGSKAKLSDLSAALSPLLETITKKTGELSSIFSSLVSQLSGSTLAVSSDSVPDNSTESFSQVTPEAQASEKAIPASEKITENTVSEPASSKMVMSEYFKKGVAAFNDKAIEQARDNFQKELTINPDNWQAMNYLSKIYLNQGQYDQAIEEINKALVVFKRLNKLP